MQLKLDDLNLKHLNGLPGSRSSKSFSNLNAVQGFTLTVAAASTGRPAGIFKTWCSNTTKCLDHEPTLSIKTN